MKSLIESLTESLFDDDLVSKDIPSFGDKYEIDRISISFNSGSTFPDKYKKILSCFPTRELKKLLTPDEIKEAKNINLDGVEVRGIDSDSEKSIFEHLKYVIAVVNKIPDIPEQYNEYSEKMFSSMLKVFRGVGWKDWGRETLRSRSSAPTFVLSCNTSYKSWIVLSFYFIEK